MSTWIFTKDFAIFIFIFFLCLSVRHTLFTPFNSLSAPTSLSAMSKLFKYVESLGKSNGMMWSQIRFFCSKIVKKIAAAKKFLQIFFFNCLLRLTVFLPPLLKVKCPNFLDIRNPCGIVMKRSGLAFKHYFSKMV